MKIAKTHSLTGEKLPDLNTRCPMLLLVLMFFIIGCMEEFSFELYMNLSGLFFPDEIGDIGRYF